MGGPIRRALVNPIRWIHLRWNHRIGFSVMGSYGAPYRGAQWKAYRGPRRRPHTERALVNPIRWFHLRWNHRIGILSWIALGPLIVGPTNARREAPDERLL